MIIYSPPTGELSRKLRGGYIEHRIKSVEDPRESIPDISVSDLVAGIQLGRKRVAKAAQLQAVPEKKFGCLRTALIALFVLGLWLLAIWGWVMIPVGGHR